MQCACHIIFLSVACPALQYFFKLSHKGHNKKKKGHKMFVLIFAATLV